MIFLAAAPAHGGTTAPLSLLHLAQRSLLGGARDGALIRVEEVSKAMLRARLAVLPPFVQRVTPPESCVTFDMPGLLYLRDVTKRVLLAEEDVEAALKPCCRESGTAERLLLDVAAALETSERVLVFSETLRRELARFTGLVPSLVTAPALPPFRNPPGAGEGAVLVFDHLGDPGLLTAAGEILRRVAPERRLVLCASPLEGVRTESFFQAAPQLAHAHIHLGVPVPPRLGARLVDSFACRRPVVQWIPACDRIGAGIGPGDGGSDGILRHRVTGFLCNDGAGLEAALGHIASDPAILEIVLRNGDRIVETNNLQFETALRELTA